MLNFFEWLNENIDEEKIGEKIVQMFISRKYNMDDIRIYVGQILQRMPDDEHVQEFISNYITSEVKSARLKQSKIKNLCDNCKVNTQSIGSRFCADCTKNIKHTIADQNPITRHFNKRSQYSKEDLGATRYGIDDR